MNIYEKALNEGRPVRSPLKSFMLENKNSSQINPYVHLSTVFYIPMIDPLQGKMGPLHT